MRILTGCLMQESNTFSPLRSTLDTFRAGCLLSGPASLSAFEGRGIEVSGFLAAAEREGVELVPTLSAWASSGGPMDAADFHRLVDDLLLVAQAARPYDGVLLALHGAWVAEDEPDADGHVLARLRELVGPAIPIVASLDLHANVTERMVAAADALVGYRSYPHVDVRETGERAATLLFRAARGEARPVTAMRKVPMLVPPEFTQTTDGSMAELQARARDVERAPGCLAASLFPVQPWLDVPELGLAAVVVADGDRAAAQRAADRLAGDAWGRRKDFVVPLVAPEAAVAQALAEPSGPVVLVDSADSTSSGSTGDSTAILRALLAARPSRAALLTLVDPRAARAAADAGEGARMPLEVGGALDPARHAPARIDAVVEAVRGGRFAFTAGIGNGLASDMGAAAVVRSGAIRIVLMERAVPCYDPALYRSVGLEPRDAHVVVVKSPTNVRWTYRDVARRMIYVDAPGASTPKLASLPYARAPRPLYPLDELEWRVPADPIP